MTKTEGCFWTPARANRSCLQEGRFLSGFPGKSKFRIDHRPQPCYKDGRKDDLGAVRQNVGNHCGKKDV